MRTAVFFGLVNVALSIRDLAGLESLGYELTRILAIFIFIMIIMDIIEWGMNLSKN